MFLPVTVIPAPSSVLRTDGSRPIIPPVISCPGSISARGTTPGIALPWRSKPNRPLIFVRHCFQFLGRIFRSVDNYGRRADTLQTDQCFHMITNLRVIRRTAKQPALGTEPHMVVGVAGLIATLSIMMSPGCAASIAS